MDEQEREVLQKYVKWQDILNDFNSLQFEVYSSMQCTSCSGTCNGSKSGCSGCGPM